MRATVAKRIRKHIYKDYSIRVRRYKRLSNGMIVNTGLREDYIINKKAYKSNRRYNEI